MNDVMPGSTEDFGRFEKSQLVELSSASGEDGWLSKPGQWPYGGCHTCWGVQMEKPA